MGVVTTPPHGQIAFLKKPGLPRVKDAVDQLGPFNNDDVFTVVGEDITEKIQRITEKFKNHPSITKIKENSKDTRLFKFHEIFQNVW